MKIGILTFNYAQNFGAVLQCYALSRVLENLGASVSVLDYEPEYQKSGNAILSNPFLVFRYKVSVQQKFIAFCKTVGLNLRAPGKIMKRYRFRKFRNKYLNETIILKNQIQTIKVADSFDSVVVGSDQIWCKKLTGANIDYVYFLKDAKCLKYTYAASAGSEFESKDLKDIIELLKGFRGLSLRERNLYQQMKNIGLNPRLDLDPTLLLTAMEWDCLASTSRLNVQGNFILFYSLEKSEEMLNVVEKLQDLTGGCIIDISPINCLKKVKKNIIKKRWISPVDFLWYIKHASYVVTNSFHGNVFALQFGSPLISVLNSNSPDRVLSLFNLLKIDNYLYSSEKDICDCIFKSDNTIQALIDRSRKESRMYLKRIVEGGDKP